MPGWTAVLVEGLLVGAGVILFGWWQIRSVRRSRDEDEADERSGETVEWVSPEERLRRRSEASAKAEEP